MSKILLPLTSIKRAAPETVLADLRSDNRQRSQEAGQNLLHTAQQYGLSMRDYLRLAIDPSLSNQKEQFDGLNGYEAALLTLGLPVSDDFDSGITLDLASDTFNTFPGTRAMFPEVIDDLVQWKYRQDQFEQVANVIASSRTISGVEMITTVVNDKQDDYAIVGPVAELANIPVQSIRTTQNAVEIFKIGGGYRTSYEFSRRARLDILTPYANRINRELERSKLAAAVALMINGDAVHSGASVVNQSSLNGGSVGSATNGQLSYKNLLSWLVSRAKAGVPVDTVVGNWDAYIEWLLMFAVPLTTGGTQSRTAAENMAAAGFRVGGVPVLNGTVNFAIGSTMSASQLMGITKGETVEELVEAGSLIVEAERAVTNQSITYVKSEVSGYRLVFPDTRSIYDYSA